MLSRGGPGLDNANDNPLSTMMHDNDKDNNLDTPAQKDTAWKSASQAFRNSDQFLRRSGAAHLGWER
jgi:hypothetical protein